MASFKKIGIGVGVTVVLLGAWVGVKTFTGKPVGAECHAGSDSDCKGMSAQCRSSKAGNYCSNECRVDKDCPASWSCSAIEVTEIDGHGNMKHRESSLKLCQRGLVSQEPAASNAAPAASAPASTTSVSAGTVPAPSGAPSAEPVAVPAAAEPKAAAPAAAAKPKAAPSAKPKPKPR